MGVHIKADWVEVKCKTKSSGRETQKDLCHSSLPNVQVENIRNLPRSEFCFSTSSNPRKVRVSLQSVHVRMCVCAEL